MNIYDIYMITYIMSGGGHMTNKKSEEGYMLKVKLQCIRSLTIALFLVICIVNIIPHHLSCKQYSSPFGL